MRGYLVRGMLSGIAAGILAFGFAHQVGEPSIGRAIAFETQRQIASGEPADPEIFSRAIQSGVGLFTAVLAVGTALGGLFAIACAFAYGRVGRLGSRATALVLAALAFVAIDLVPGLKYPANPPSVGVPATIGLRTELYFSMIAVSLATMLLAAAVGFAARARVGTWNAWIVAALTYVVATSAAAALLPAIDEVPSAFSATLLWQFRTASIGTFAILWSTIGLVFGALTERDERRAARPAAQETRPAGSR